MKVSLSSSSFPCQHGWPVPFSPLLVEEQPRLVSVTHGAFMLLLYMEQCWEHHPFTQERCNLPAFSSQAYFQASLEGAVSKLHLFSILFFLPYNRLKNCRSFFFFFLSFVNTLLNCGWSELSWDTINPLLPLSLNLPRWWQSIWKKLYANVLYIFWCYRAEESVSDDDKRR